MHRLIAVLSAVLLVVGTSPPMCRPMKHRPPDRCRGRPFCDLLTQLGNRLQLKATPRAWRPAGRKTASSSVPTGPGPTAAKASRSSSRRRSRPQGGPASSRSTQPLAAGQRGPRPGGSDCRSQAGRGHRRRRGCRLRSGQAERPLADRKRPRDASPTCRRRRTT